MPSLVVSDAVEPILAENPQRFCMFPIKYAEVWEMYKKAEASFWTGVTFVYSAWYLSGYCQVFSPRFLYWLCVSMLACFRIMKLRKEHNLEDDCMSNLEQSCLLVCVICLHCSWGGRSVSRSETLGCLEIWRKAFHQPCVGLLCCLWWNCAWESGWPIHERDSDSRGMQWAQPVLWIQATCKGGQWSWVEQP